jgi:hypothetical protein
LNLLFYECMALSRLDPAGGYSPHWLDQWSNGVVRDVTFDITFYVTFDDIFGALHVNTCKVYVLY